MIPQSVIDNAAQPCRLERVQPEEGQAKLGLEERGISIYLDVCHNEQGIDAVLSELTLNISPDKPLILLFGASIGKKVGNILKVIGSYADKI